MGHRCLRFVIYRVAASRCCTPFARFARPPFSLPLPVPHLVANCRSLFAFLLSRVKRRFLENDSRGRSWISNEPVLSRNIPYLYIGRLRSLCRFSYILEEDPFIIDVFHSLE